jgi:primosomal protein N' (replication factor Y) (superfamily II helicase)
MDVMVLNSGIKKVSVAVSNVAYSFDKPYTYSVPFEFENEVQKGKRVLVPFGYGNRKRTALILSVLDEELLCKNVKIKPVFAVIDKEPIINSEMLELIYWLKENTFCTYYDALKSMIPSGLNVTITEKYKLTSKAINFDLEMFDQEEINMLNFLINAKSKKEFDMILDDNLNSKKSKIIESLIEKEMIEKTSQAKQNIKDYSIKMVKLTDKFVINPADFKVTTKQKQIIQLLEENFSAAVKEIVYLCNVTNIVIKNLIKNGVIEEFEYETFRKCENENDFPQDVEELKLSENQENIKSEIFNKVEKNEPDCFLIHGVTGSGKTSVFIKLIEQTIATNKQAIMLIPEISLTPQIEKKFKSYFGDIISVMHSNLSLTQRVEEYKKVKQGKSRIVIGTRSAVFAPFENIGLIIMDEEGERSYKSENSPRYNTVSVAKQRCKIHNAVLVLASATPSIESYYYAKKGVYKLLELKERFFNSQLPKVEIIDMSVERNEGNYSEFSRTLIEEIELNIKNSEQTILLLNRRGYYSIMSCCNCNAPVYCKNCTIPMTYHKINNRMICHYCGHSEDLIDTCENCGGQRFKQIGFGTQKIEEDLSFLFKDARILRMDADTTFSRYAYEKSFDDFSKGKYDIMLGTQMIGKGLDFPNVTLVGVLSIDKALFAGDFRSYERTFSLITQVVGRSGRGEKKGRAYLQTFMPEHYVLNLAANQEYESFFNEEIALRRSLIFPPICDVCIFGISSKNDDKASDASNTLLAIIKDKVIKEQIKFPLRILGPAKYSLSKINNKFRYRIIMKCKNNFETRKFISEILLETAKYKEFSTVSLFADINGDLN